MKKASILGEIWCVNIIWDTHITQRLTDFAHTEKENKNEKS